MLTSTFSHIQGITSDSEAHLWASGIEDWNCINQSSIFPDRFPEYLKQRLKHGVAASRLALETRNVSYFAVRLRQIEHWRAASAFQLCCLDIETDGGRDAASVSLVGLHDGTQYQPFLRGANLESLPSVMAKYDGFVTFYGSGFDLPILQSRFPVLSSVLRARLHIDLCHLYHGLGIPGGMKSIEKTMGIARADDLDNLTGADAAYLSRSYLSGGEDASQSLTKLLRYNELDTANLWVLFSLILPKLYERAGYPNRVWRGIIESARDVQAS